MDFYQKVLFSDLDSFMEQIRSWNLDFRQLDRGSFKGMLIQYGFSDAQIGIGSFNRKFDQRGEAPSGLISFALFGQEGPPIIWRGSEVDHNTIMVYRPGDEIDCSSEPNFNVITYSTSEESFLAHCHNRGFHELVSTLRHRRIFPIRVGDKQKLIEIVARTNRIAAQSCEGIDKDMIRDILQLKITEMFIEALADSVGPAVKSPITARSEQALRVIEKSLKYASPPPAKVRELCEMTGVSERTLQYLFMWKYGVTPMTYLKRARLNEVRKVLRSATPQKLKVSDIANQMGFWHMGQFAKDYHQLFGELPSKSLTYGRSSQG